VSIGIGSGPRSASNRDPLERRVLAVALAPSGAARCGDGAGAGWLVILIPAFESPAIVAGFDDVAMVGQPIEQGRPIGARRLAREVRPDWLLTKPSSLRGICRPSDHYAVASLAEVPNCAAPAAKGLARGLLEGGGEGRRTSARLQVQRSR
jgi:hypothetical protein